MSMTTDQIRTSLESGFTLPASWYSDPEVERLEREHIFRRSWQYAGPAEQVAEPGTYFATRVGHVPVVIVRDRDETLRGFVNVCRHRSYVIAEGSGRRESLQCPYHAWTYGLDGCLRSAPRANREPGFDRADYSLLPVSVEQLGPLVFANPDPDAAPLAESLGDLPLALTDGGLELDRLRLRRRTNWAVDANWKNVMENYLECYHCAVAHPGLSDRVDVGVDAYELRWAGLVGSQFGNARRPEEWAGACIQRAQYHLLFPSTSFNVELGPMNLSVDASLPLGPGRMRGISDSYFADDVSDAEVDELVAFAKQVNDEDTGLVEGVQAGLDSGMVPQGRLLTSSEHQIGHFQRLVFDAVVGER